MHINTSRSNVHTGPAWIINSQRSSSFTSSARPPTQTYMMRIDTTHVWALNTAKILMRIIAAHILSCTQNMMPCHSFSICICFRCQERHRTCAIVDGHIGERVYWSFASFRLRFNQFSFENVSYAQPMNYRRIEAFSRPFVWASTWCSARGGAAHCNNRSGENCGRTIQILRRTRTYLRFQERHRTRATADGKQGILKFWSTCLSFTGNRNSFESVSCYSANEWLFGWAIMYFLARLIGASISCHGQELLRFVARRTYP